MSLSDLIPKFQFEKLLSSDSQLKTLALLGTIDKKPAILQLEKTHFNYTEDDFKQLPITEINTLVNNDVYFWGMNLLKQDLINSPSSKLNLIYPATEIHIRKFNKKNIHMIKETPEVYNNIVKPYIDTMKGDRIKWVKNILYEGAEADRVVYKNKDFVMIPDMKWDGENMESLYLCCIVMREDISSIRDLNESHIEYLESILNDIRIQVPNYYKDDSIKKDRLRIYIHYQPSYYHFHIHVVNSNYNGLGESIMSGKAILLDEVIDNLRILGEDGYKRKTMNYSLNESHPLWELGLKDHTV